MKLAPPKRKLFELVILLSVNLVIYFIWEAFGFMALYSLGFVWNWVASQELPELMDNRRYRYSSVRLVKNLQIMIQSPLVRAPGVVQWIARSLPAGIFWGLVIFLNDSEMPWWATFLGSLSYELLSLEVRSIMRERSQAP